MPGTVLVSFDGDRDVYVDNQKSGTTNEPFEVEIGTHDIDLGGPDDYTPATRHVRVLSRHSPLKPLRLTFERES